MEEGFVEAEYDRMNLERHAATVNQVAESLRTDGGAAATAAAANATRANANDTIVEEANQSTIRRNRVPRDQYSALQLEGDAVNNKLNVWLGQRESEEGGHRSVHNLVRHFLTLHGLLVSVRGPLPDLNRRSEDQKKTLKDMGLAHGMSDADKRQKCEEKMTQRKELEKKIQATLSEYRVAFLKIIPEAEVQRLATTSRYQALLTHPGTPARNLNASQGGEAAQDDPELNNKRTIKAVPELKPKEVLMMTASRTELQE